MDLKQPFIENSLKENVGELEFWFRNVKSALVAFSGGVDSALVLYLAREFLGKENAIGIISNSDSLKSRDLEDAGSFCDKYDIKLEVIETKEILDINYNTNPIDRCFYCKHHLYMDMTSLLERFPGYSILNGTNLDDLGDYRPGNRAATEFSVLSPLLDCKINKEKVRKIANFYGLPNWDKPASPCLSSRIPYNQLIDKVKLKQIEMAEAYLFDLGFKELRVRHFGKFAKIEVPKKEIPEIMKMEKEVFKKLRVLGFEYCEIDLDGLQSGKLNTLVGK